jgi:hypothetical protein
MSFKFDPALRQVRGEPSWSHVSQHSWDWLELKRSENCNLWKIIKDGKPPCCWRSEYKNRCLNDSDTFIGGNSGTPVKSIVQDASGKHILLVISAMKNAGEYSCGLQ